VLKGQTSVASRQRMTCPYLAGIRREFRTVRCALANRRALYSDRRDQPLMALIRRGVRLYNQNLA